MAGRGRKRKSANTEKQTDKPSQANEEPDQENPSQANEEPNNPKQEDDEKIAINRAPVLTLWVAVVAERQGYSYQEGLSFGKAIAGILAHSKGRRLGIYEDAEQEGRKRKRKQQKFEVFGMRIAGQNIKEGTRLAVQNGKPISPPTVDSYLRRAFGSQYQKVKEEMQALAKAYPPQRIGSEAYSLYEKFRPQVAGGVRGWGAKGHLDLGLLHQLQKEAANASN